jgi:hypothetical protein
MNSLLENQDEFDDLDSFAEAWMAKPGDRLIGTVTGLSSRISDYDATKYPIVTVRTDSSGRSTEDGQPIPAGTEKAFHAFRTVAKNELAQLRPRLGDRIGIAYHGKSEHADWHSYRIKVPGRESGETPDWDAMQADTETDVAEVADDGEEKPTGGAGTSDIPFRPTASRPRP